MFSAFDSTYRLDDSIPAHGSDSKFGEFPELRLFFSRYGGGSFNNGLYRVMAEDSISAWESDVVTAFPEFAGHITCFGMDWLGRIFALDSRRLELELPGVVLFEPGTGDSFEVPANIITFHNDVLLNLVDAAVAESFYRKWIASGGVAPQVHQCVGYKRPLFLGGQDNVSNLELSDLEVYWSLCSQLIQRTRDVPIGTPIGDISLKDKP